MNEKKIKALFLDVDGTLVSFKTHRVPDSAREALLEAHNRGIRLFIATGRAATDLEIVSHIPYDGVVALNGSECILRSGEPVSLHRIPKSDFLRALACSDESGFPVALELNEGIFVNRVTPVVREWAHLVAHPVPVETDLAALFDRVDCCQMCFFFDEGQQQRVMPAFPGLTATRWCPLFADINVQGVDKASGMAEFAARFGFAADETMAFGDGGNDIAMLRAAGVGVALGNARDEVKHAADYVTTGVDRHGIRRALEHFGII